MGHFSTPSLKGFASATGTLDQWRWLTHATDYPDSRTSPHKSGDWFNQVGDRCLRGKVAGAFEPCRWAAEAAMHALAGEPLRGNGMELKPEFCRQHGPVPRFIGLGHTA